MWFATVVGFLFAAATYVVMGFFLAIGFGAGQDTYRYMSRQWTVLSPDGQTATSTYCDMV